MKREFAEYLLSKTKADYNLISEEFSRTRENVWEEIKFLFYDYLVAGEKVLDLGCGNARYYELFKNKQVSYFGIDNSEKLIEIARKKYPEAKFQVGDALDLPFPNNYFDKIYSIAVFHHIPSRDLRMQFLNESRRVLKQGGIIILTVWKFHEPKEIFLRIRYTLLKLLGLTKLDFKDILEPWGKQAKRYYHWFSEKELRKEVSAAGFKIKETGVTKNKKGNRQNIYLVAEK